MSTAACRGGARARTRALVFVTPNNTFRRFFAKRKAKLALLS